MRTERLLLQTAVAADEDAIRSYRSDPETRPLAVVAADIVVIELDGVVVGNVLISLEERWSQVEVQDEGAGTRAEIGWVAVDALGAVVAARTRRRRQRTRVLVEQLSAGDVDRLGALVHR